MERPSEVTFQMDFEKAAMKKQKGFESTERTMSKQDTEVQITKSTSEVEDPQRRKFLGKATKLAVYTAPTLTAISFVSSAHAQLSPPPPPGSEGQITAEDRKKKPPNQR
jgi:hypothetical protein